MLKTKEATGKEMQLLLSINFHLEQKSQNSEKMFNTIYLEILKIVDLKQKVLD